MAIRAVLQPDRTSMTGLIRLSLGMRIAALFALPLGILTCVVLQRSPVMIILLAGAMTFVRPVVLRLVKSQPPPWPSYPSLAAKFLGLTLLGAILFVAFAGIGALFTEMDLENRIGPADGMILAFWSAFAAVCLGVPVRLLDGMTSEVHQGMRFGPFGLDDGPGRAGEADGVIIEGEVIRDDPEDDGPAR